MLVRYVSFGAPDINSYLNCTLFGYLPFVLFEGVYILKGNVQTFFGKYLTSLYSTGHFIVDMTLCQTLGSGKDTLLHNQMTTVMSHTKQFN